MALTGEGEQEAAAASNLFKYILTDPGMGTVTIDMQCYPLNSRTRYTIEESLEVLGLDSKDFGRRIGHEHGDIYSFTHEGIVKLHEAFKKAGISDPGLNAVFNTRHARQVEERRQAESRGRFLQS